MPIQQTDLAVPVREASIRCAQAGGGDVLTLGVQRTGNGDDLQGPRCNGELSVVDSEVWTGVELFLREGNIAVLIRKFIICQCVYSVNFRNRIIFYTKLILAEVSLEFDVTVVLSRQCRSVVFLCCRLNGQGRFRDRRLRFGDGQGTECLHREVFAGIQICLCKYRFTLSILELITADGRFGSNLGNRVVCYCDLVFTDRAAEQITLFTLHGQRSPVIFLACIQASQGERGDRRLIRLRRGVRLLNCDGNIPVDSADVIECRYICLSVVDMNRICVHNGVKPRSSPLSADDVLAPDLMPVKQACGLVTVGIAFSTALSQCDSLVRCLNSDGCGDASNDQGLLF